MLSFADAKQLLLDEVQPRETETINTRNARGRILTGDICTSRPFPDMPKSAVDGYGVGSAGLGPYRLVATIAAGEHYPHPLRADEAIAVMTGSVVADGSYAVVRVEETQIETGQVYLIREPGPQENINAIGEECSAGYCFAKRGQRIDHGVYAALYYAGIQQVEVYRQMVVGIMITGDELSEIEDAVSPGQVFNTNRYIVESFLERLGIKYEFFRCVGDDLDHTAQALDEMVQRYDLIVTTGGVSMGQFDFVKQVLNSEDYEPLIRQTAIKPGRPLMVMRRKQRLIFGMPGYPVALTTNLILYLLPVLKKMAGYSHYNHRPLMVKLATPFRSRMNRFDLNRALIEVRDGIFIASDVDSQKTSHYLNFAQVNGLLMMDENTGSLAPGDEILALLYAVEFSA